MGVDEGGATLGTGSASPRHNLAGSCVPAYPVANANMLFLPRFGSYGVAASLDHHALEGFDARSHPHVQLLLHQVQVELNVRPQHAQEGQRLLYCFRWFDLGVRVG